MSIQHRPLKMVKILLMFIIVLLNLQLAYAQEEPVMISKKNSSNEGYHTHDGFFMRMTLGGGFYSIKGSGTGANVTNPQGNRGGQSLTFAFGGMVVENFALYADFHFYGSAQNNHRMRFGNYLMNLGTTYYFMPLNFYISGSVGYAGTLIYTSSEDGAPISRNNFEDAYGVGLSASIGKEWWVSANWGLGLALESTYSYTTDDHLTFHQGTLMVKMSATFN